jgi:hypothetical protein
MGNPVTYTVGGIAAATGLAATAAVAVIEDEDTKDANDSTNESTPLTRDPSLIVLKRRITTPRSIDSDVDHTSEKISKLAAFCSGFLGASLAEVTTLPLDTGKVRMQLDNTNTFKTPIHALKHVVENEGIIALWGGLPAGLLRAGLMYSVRLTAYDAMLNKVAKNISAISNIEKQDEVKSWVSTKLLTAIPCSALSVCFANPADVLKVRFQKNSNLYTRSSIHPKTISEIIMREGFFSGLYSGFLPNISRNCAVGGAELVGYYQSKEILLNTFHMNDSTPVHVMASFGAAMSAMLIGSPFDVLGTRLMQKEAVLEGKGVVSFTKDIIKKEGVSGFYKGGSINLARLWSFNLVLCLGYENIKRKVGEWGL